MQIIKVVKTMVIITTGNKGTTFFLMPRRNVNL
jgi:hypothetical protein